MATGPLTINNNTTITGGKQSYGGILISPRHVLYCEHSKPHARNTWFVNYNSTKECNLNK